MSTHALKRSQLTIGLSALFIALIGIIVWMELGDKRAATNVNQDIQSIVIKRNGHPDIELNRAGNQWKMSAPYSMNANAQRIDPLLSLGKASFDGYEKNEVDLNAAGLNSPAATVIIGNREFQLGVEAADGERRYTLVDNKVSFVPSWVWSLIHGGVTAFADLTVFTQLPDPLYMINGDDTTKGATQIVQPEKLLNLQADKITAWPTAQNDDDASVVKLHLSPTTHIEDSIAQWRRTPEQSWISLNGEFAYAISNARLDALLQR